MHFSLRAKYHKLKYGTELNQGDMKPPSYDSGKPEFTHVLKFSRDEVIKASDPIFLLYAINPAALQARA